MLRADFSLTDADAPEASGGVLELIRNFFTGGPPLDEATIAAGLARVEAVVRAFQGAGFGDVISLLVEDRPAFTDDAEQPNDALEAVGCLLAAWDPEHRDARVEMVSSHEADGVHSLATLDATPLAEDGAERFAVHVSARLHALRVLDSEGPSAYRERVRAALATGIFETRAEAAERTVQSLTAALTASAPTIHAEASIVRRVVVPGSTQVGRFRTLGFRDRVRDRTYRATRYGPRRSGPFDDPHVYHYYDPYHDLLAWILVEEAVAGRWGAPGVVFMTPEGKPLATGATALAQVANDGALPVSLDQVTFEENDLTVHDDLPAVGFHPAEAGSPHAPGYGGENA